MTTQCLLPGQGEGWRHAAATPLLRRTLPPGSAASSAAATCSTLSCTRARPAHPDRPQGSPSTALQSFPAPSLQHRDDALHHRATKRAEQARPRAPGPHLAATAALAPAGGARRGGGHARSRSSSAGARRGGGGLKAEGKRKVLQWRTRQYMDININIIIYPTIV